MPSQPDIVCYYADFGRPYFPVMEKMVTSVRRVMPESKIFLLSPTPETECGKLFDSVISVPLEAKVETLCLDRARAMASWQINASRDTIYVDPDIEFLKPVDIIGEYDVGLCWRRRQPSQPVNTGLIIAKGKCDKFWTRYIAVTQHLPIQLHSWWCDQLALSEMVGCVHEAGETLSLLDARVALFDSEYLCVKPEAATAQTLTIHYKGSRKGEPWEKYFPPRKVAA